MYHQSCHSHNMISSVQSPYTDSSLSQKALALQSNKAPPASVIRQHLITSGAQLCLMFTHVRISFNASMAYHIFTCYSTSYLHVSCSEQTVVHMHRALTGCCARRTHSLFTFPHCEALPSFGLRDIFEAHVQSADLRCLFVY